MMNRTDAVKRAFKQLHDRAEEIRIMENKIIENYRCGFSKKEIKDRTGCTYKYITRVLECHLTRK